MTRKPRLGNSFVWQAVVIVVPLLVLTVFAVTSVQQDLRLARLAASERAQSLADSLLPKLWHEIAQLTNASPIHFVVDPSSTLVWPPLITAPEELAAQNSAETNPGSALFRNAVLLMSRGETQKAGGLFRRVTQEFPNAKGETGLPLAPLAEFKLLQILRDTERKQVWGPAFQTFCSNLVSRPTCISGFLLSQVSDFALNHEDRATLETWQAQFERQAQARDTYAAASTMFGNLSGLPELVSFGPESFLLSQPDIRTNRTFHALRRADVVERITTILRNAVASTPYLGVVLDVDGFSISPSVTTEAQLNIRSPVPPAATTLGPGLPVLASAMFNSGGQDILKLNVLLVDSAGLYRQQRVRSYRMGGFIALSLGAAVFGLFGAWHSFRKQEQLNLLKSNFVSSVSHELRAPIASVRLMAENLELGKVIDENRRSEYFRFIGQECRRLSSLVENVLDFSRIEQGRRQYEMEPCDLAAIIRSTVQLMQLPATEKDVSMRLDFPSDNGTSAVPINADGKALQQAVVNLVDNAIKHSPPGSVVHVGLQVSKEPPGAARVWVEDHGVGIPATDHERIFERFYRRGSELRRETQGIGIGLSIVKHVVEAHRGSVHVRSAPGQGSRFTIELPLGNDEPPHA